MNESELEAVEEEIDNMFLENQKKINQLEPPKRYCIAGLATGNKFDDRLDRHADILFDNKKYGVYRNGVD